jgi:PPOX class probable F420-dependent enzyme
VAELEQPPPWALALLQEARVAHLGLLDPSGAPRVQPVAFALHAGRIWTAVDAKRKRLAGEHLGRVRFIRRDPRVALTVDRYDEDWGRLAWVQALARAEVLAVSSDGQALAGLEALAVKYPPYRATPPAGPLIALAPVRWLWWRAND